MRKIRIYLGIISLMFTLMIVGRGFLKGFDFSDLVLNVCYFTIIVIDQVILLHDELKRQE